MKKRRLLTLVILLTMVMLMAVPVSANGPMPMHYYQIELSNLPEGTAYVDLLIRLPESDPMYTALNTENIPEGFDEQAQILTYCADNYRSYTFHYQDALSILAPRTIHWNDRESTYVAFFMCNGKNGTTIVRSRHMEDVETRGRIRLALLDAQGNILEISEPLEPRPDGFLAFMVGLAYDAGTGILTVESAVSSIGAALYVLLCLIGVVLTCLLEWLTAGAFHLKTQYGRLIVMTNLVSQVAMRVVFVLLYRSVFRDYAYLTLALEALVYLGEFLFYRSKMRDISTGKCLAYTIAANTVSLVLGFYLNRMLFQL